MLKGCSKRVVVVKDIESGLFEEAYFIVRTGAWEKNMPEEACLREASRLAASGSGSLKGGKNPSSAPFSDTPLPAPRRTGWENTQKKKNGTPLVSRSLGKFLLFASGFLCGSALLFALFHFGML